MLAGCMNDRFKQILIVLIFAGYNLSVLLLLLLLLRIFIQDKATSVLETLLAMWVLCSECIH